jgi:5-methyltetrahydrofolate--homocysteine methyltransferase
MNRLPWLHPERIARLEAALAQRILVIDGAMGTMIQRHELQEADYRGERFAHGYDAMFAGDGHAHGAGCGCEAHDQRGNNDLLTLTRPDLIRDIHAAYLAAGADLVETNTFNSTAISLADYHLQHLVRELYFEGAALARRACDDAEARDPSKPRFVIGVLGPTSRTASLSPDVNVSTHPNAGLPNAFGGYDETPEDMAGVLREFAQAGLLNLVGGCCGTTPEHVSALAEAVRGLPPRPIPQLEQAA